MKSRDLIAMLIAAGWKLRSTRGSHHVFRHPDRPGLLVVPHPRLELGKGLVIRILKDAGIQRH